MATRDQAQSALLVDPCDIHTTCVLSNVRHKVVATIGIGIMKTVIFSAVIAVAAVALFSPAKVAANPTGTDCYNNFAHCMKGDKTGFISNQDQIKCQQNLEYCLSQVKP